MRTCIKTIMESDEKKDIKRPHLKIVLNQLNLNVGMIWTNGDLSEVKRILDSQVREAPAKIGSIAPIDVTIPAGSTGMDPKQTSFFQALNITTKIVKGVVEIVNPVKVITEGDKVSPGQAALLDKLKIRPFEYKMHILNVLDGDALFPPKILSITPASILAAFSSAAQNVAAMSLGSGFATQASVHHSIINAFKNLAAVSFSTGFSFPQAEKLRSAAASAPAASSAAATTSAPVAAKKEEPKQEEVDMDMGDLFGGDY